jgi:hypothetical protein
MGRVKARSRRRRQSILFLPKHRTVAVSVHRHKITRPKIGKTKISWIILYYLLSNECYQNKLASHYCTQHKYLVCYQQSIIFIIIYHVQLYKQYRGCRLFVGYIFLSKETNIYSFTSILQFCYEEITR